MSLIIGKDVCKSYGMERVLEEVSFRVSPGEHVGLVGPNGGGKTTLLRIVGGLVEPTSGHVQHKRGLRIGLLPQEPPAPKDVTLWEAMLEVFADLRAIEAQIHALAERLGGPDGDEAALKRFGALQQQFEARGGYTYKTRTETVLTGLGFTHRQHAQPMSELSGGQRTRALLGQLLLAEPEVLLLDEPTNHLDMEASEWLEEYLAGFAQAIVVVSHDRYFLDKVTAVTWELSFARLEYYPGSYSGTREERTRRLETRRRQYEAQQEYIARTEDYIQRNIAGQRGAEARGRRTRLERFLKTEAIERPRDEETISLNLSPVGRSGDIVFRARGLAAGYEPRRPVVAAEELEVLRGQRVAIVGGNGTGKTTLLRTLLGELPPLGGSVQPGAGVVTGYLSQTHDDLAPGATVLDSVLAAAGDATPGRVRGLLGRFLFTGDEALKRIEELSGGQRSRVVLARLAVSGANVLLLDEPTNHLDLPSREVLQDVLKDFAGTIVLVSHDRYLIESLATDLWAIDGGRVHRVHGGWASYLKWRAARARRMGSASPVADGHAAHRDQRRAAAQADRDRRKRLATLQRKHARAEADISRLEDRLRELTMAISVAGEAGNVEEIHRLGKQYTAVEADLKKAWDHWTRLADQLEKFQGRNE